MDTKQDLTERSMYLMKINIGCGGYPIKGYINIDKLEKFSEFNYDAWELPYEDNSIDEIYAGHVVEHLPYDKIQDTLKEWNRVLSPQGTVTIVIPDMVKAIEWFKSGKFTFDEVQGIFYGYWKSLDWEEGHHLFVCDTIIQGWMQDVFSNVEILNHPVPQMTSEIEWQSIIQGKKGA